MRKNRKSTIGRDYCGLGHCETRCWYVLTSDCSIAVDDPSNDLSAKADTSEHISVAGLRACRNTDFCRVRLNLRLLLSRISVPN